MFTKEEWIKTVRKICASYGYMSEKKIHSNGCDKFGFRLLTVCVQWNIWRSKMSIFFLQMRDIVCAVLDIMTGFGGLNASMNR